MNLPDIQTNLQSIVSGVASLTGQSILIDNGAQEEVMETALNGSGLTILIMPPQAFGREHTNGGVKLVYTSTVWVRVNPKAETQWNPLSIEALIISAVMQWSKGRSDHGFVITPDLEPETDWTDLGNNSRLIRFATGVLFQ